VCVWEKVCVRTHTFSHTLSLTNTHLQRERRCAFVRESVCENTHFLTHTFSHEHTLRTWEKVCVRERKCVWEHTLSHTLSLTNTHLERERKCVFVRESVCENTHVLSRSNCAMSSPRERGHALLLTLSLSGELMAQLVLRCIHTATHRNTLQHAATRCNTQAIFQTHGRSHWK